MEKNQTGIKTSSPGRASHLGSILKVELHMPHSSSLKCVHLSLCLLFLALGKPASVSSISPVQ